MRRLVEDQARRLLEAAPCVSARPGRESQAAIAAPPEAAIAAPPDAQPSAAAPPAEDALRPRQFAILRRQTEEELVFSEVHAQLDRVLAFLQQVVGYSLLDDARPEAAGAVVLAPHRPKAQRLLDSPLVAGERGARGRDGRPTRLPTQEPDVPEEEVRQVLRFSRATARYARYPDDLVLVWRLAERLAEGSPQAAVTVRTEQFYKTVLKGVRLMHLCDFSYSDVVVTLAYASVYFTQAYSECGSRMGDDEAAHVCLLLIYLAQVFVLDEICPLKCWQHHVFRNYCSVRILNAALFRLFHLRGFQLRISEEEEQQALKALLCTSADIDLVLGLDESAPSTQSRFPEFRGGEQGEHAEHLVANGKPKATKKSVEADAIHLPSKRADAGVEGNRADRSAHCYVDSNLESSPPATADANVERGLHEIDTIVPGDAKVALMISEVECR